MESPIQTITNGVVKLQMGNPSVGSDQMNPLMKMKYLGDMTLSGTEAVFVLFSGGKVFAAVTTDGFWRKVISAFSGNATEGIAALL